jgi:hypothetical protein
MRAAAPERNEPCRVLPFSWPSVARREHARTVAAITVLVGAIAVRTIVVGAHGQLLPSPAGAPAMALSRPADASPPVRSAA